MGQDLRDASGQAIRPEGWIRLHFRRGLERQVFGQGEFEGMQGEPAENEYPVEWIASGERVETYLRPVLGMVVSVTLSEDEGYSLQVFDAFRGRYVLVESSDCRKICVVDDMATRYLSRYLWVDDELEEEEVR
jgi:hypothetical protein